MKRTLALLLIIVIAASCMTACKDKKNTDNSGSSGDVLEIDVTKESPDSYFKWRLDPVTYEDSTIIEGLTEEGLKQKTLVFPKKCTEIKRKALEESSVLETVAFANDDIQIDNLFSRNISIKTIVLPGKLTTIPETFFSGSGVESVLVPATVTTIEKDAFSYCESLKSIDLSKTAITTISLGSFTGCEALESVKLPDSVKVIEENAFKYCTLLKDINFPVGLEDIKDEAFRYCKNLKSVTLPESLVSVGSRTFAECPALAEIYLPETLQVIPIDAFYKMAAMEGFVQLTVYVKEGSFADTNYQDYFDGSMKKDFY